MLNIAFIGCGRISAKHFEALAALQGQIQIQALCDLELERAQNARFPNARVYDNIAAMLLRERGLQAAVVALPNGLHAEAGIQCARAGLHVIVEKPLAVRLEDGHNLAECCRKHKVELFLIHQNRFNPPIQQLYRAIRGGYLGRIYQICANVFWCRPQSYYDASWHGTREMDGGAFYTQASHYVDMVQWLAGARPRNLCARLRTLARNIETEDCGTVLLEWGQPGQQNNLIAIVNMSVLTWPQNLEGSVLVLGEKGSVKIGGTALNQVEHWQLEGLEQPASYHTDSVYGFGHQNLYAAIAARLRGEVLQPSVEAALVCGSNILDNLIILDGIQRSTRAGSRTIEL